MSCNCSVLKTNVSHAGVFGVVKLGMSGTKDKVGETKVASKLKNKVLGETAVFGLSGIIYDQFIKTWLYDMGSISGLSGNMDIRSWSNEMVKSVYQLLILGGYDFTMGKKMSIQKFLEAAVAVWGANYGVALLDSMM